MENVDVASIDLSALDTTTIGIIAGVVVLLIVVIAVVLSGSSTPTPTPASTAAAAAATTPEETQAETVNDSEKANEGSMLLTRQVEKNSVLTPGLTRDLTNREQRRDDENEAKLQWKNFEERLAGREETKVEENEVQLQWQKFRDSLQQREEAKIELNTEQLQWQKFKERYETVLDLMETNAIIRDAVFSLHFPPPYPLLTSYTEEREEVVDQAIDTVRSFWLDFMTDCRTGVLPPTDMIKEKIDHWCGPSITFKFNKFAKSYSLIWSQLEGMQDEHRGRVSTDVEDRVKFVDEIW